MSSEEREFPVGPRSGERRQVTALFYDIVGSTALLHQLDPEEFGALQRTLHNEAAALISGNGGHLERVQGDGGCAYFGYPVPSEDAAEFAVKTALQLVDWCQRLSQQVGSNLKVRVGVATGLVVVADISNTRLPDHIEVIGIAPALAARIQSEAAPNSVAVADTTHRLTSSAFEFEEIGLRELKGFGEPVQLWRPLACRRKSDRFTRYRRVSAPLVGRDDELELCVRRWARAKGGRGQFVLLHGDAGMGKSRLVAELRRVIAAEDAVALVFQCEPRGNTEPLHPFLESIREAVSEATKDAQPLREAVVHFLRKLGPEVGELNAEIVAFLLFGNVQERSSEAWQVDLSGDEIRARAVEAILAVLTASTSSGPVLIVIEDLHWADTLTKAVATRLPEWIVSRPVLFVATSREAMAAEHLGDPNVLSIALAGLTAQATSELLDRIWESPRPAELADFVYEKSDGVPLFAEQLALLLREGVDATVQSKRSEWEALLREGRVLNLQDLIAARLAGLGQLRRVAQIASVIGREFRWKLLVTLMEPEPLAVDLDAALEGLAQAGIVRRKTPDSAIRFRHVLIQEAAYDSLLKSERREIHARIVRLVQSGTVASLPDETMAWHFEQAGQPLESARCAIQAAEASALRSAMHEADRMSDFAEKQLMQANESNDASNLRLRLLTVRGPVAAALFGKGSEQARSIYEQGLSLCAERNDQDRAKWFPLYWGWWFTSPDYETQRARSDILVRDLEGSGDPEVRLQSLHCAWATNIDAGLHSRCLQCVEDGLRLYDEDRARFSRSRYGGHDAKVCGLGERAFSLWFMGDDIGSSQSVEAAKGWAVHISHLNSLLHALEFDLELTCYRNDHEGVIKVADEIAHLAQAVPDVLAKAALFRAWADGMIGDAVAGLAEFEATLIARGMSTSEGAPVYDGMRAELSARAGLNEQALSILDNAILTSTQSGQVFWLAELLRQRALFRHSRGESEQAVGTDMARALQVGGEQQAAALVARVQSDIARLGLRAPHKSA